MALREYHRPEDPKSVSQLLRRRTQPTTKAMYLSPRPIGMHKRNWESAVGLSNLELNFIQQEFK